ncbi:glyoxylate/hydroxypyruvate reductase A [Ahrensia kielensis]|uniref:Glyoxylate/hydroxypyruvate reductase A n=1 Tax=Ahrensia kielensis TaxID=76980 RepID=A0ABU9T9S4_9HYPH
MTKKILLAVTGFDETLWQAEIERMAPDLEVVTKITDDAADVEYAIVWKQRPNILSALPNLKVIFSAGAGVDHIFKDHTLPDAPIVRVVADDLTNRMSEYIIWQALDHLRQGARYRKQQADHVWLEDKAQPAADAVTVGIMGIGALGMDAAIKLKMIGFHVVGWSRNPKTNSEIETFSGTDGLHDMLSQTDILVCLLPLTDETRSIIDAQLLSKLKRNGPLGGPVLVNAGRGGLQSEADILAALNDGSLSAASLDVFEQEPLAGDSPLWSHPRVTVTPHAAAASNPLALIPHILIQIAAYERGGTLENLVDRKAGY